MCKALQDIREEGFNEGREETQLASILTLQKKLPLSIRQAMDLLDIPLEKQSYYLSKLATTPDEIPVL